VLTSGPLQLGISCQTTSTPGQIALTVYLTTPAAPTTLSAGGMGTSTYETIPSTLTDYAQTTPVEPKKSFGTSGFILAIGPDGVPYLLYVNYGANTEASTTLGPPELVMPRGCWMQTWVV
jgi:hypothetical protein